MIERLPDMNMDPPEFTPDEDYDSRELACLAMSSLHHANLVEIEALADATGEPTEVNVRLRFPEKRGDQLIDEFSDTLERLAKAVVIMYPSLKGA